MELSLTDASQHIVPLLRYWGQHAQVLASQPFQVLQKGFDDYVTTVDRELDRELASAFANLFPLDGVITEENQLSQQLFAKQAFDRFWFIDPLDGTEAFIQKQSDYSLMVGLLELGRPQAGWVYAPDTDHIVWGGPQWGLFHQQSNHTVQDLMVKAPLLPVDQGCTVVMGLKDQQHYSAAIAQGIPNVTVQATLGSFGLKILDVIRGRADLYIYLNRRVKLWDTTGPLALARAAGLVCCDLSGNPIRFDVDAIDLKTLAHNQTIVVGWPHCVEALRPKIQAAVNLD
jgi:3'(2'), 5'-bisphosphate nucleotidase